MTTGTSFEEKRQLARRLLNRGRPSAATRLPERPDHSRQLPFWHEQIASKLALQHSELERLGLNNPYFRVHDSVSGAYISIDGKDCINFSGYNYLGLSGHPEVTEAASRAIATYGTSASASRIASGEIPLHGMLESELAGFVGSEACLVFNSGFGTNSGVIGHLLGARDVVFHDEFVHASILSGCDLSGARRIPFPHNDLERLEHALMANRELFERALIIVEGVYSMDGDTPDLGRLVELKRAHNAGLMVDEAHSIGVLGNTGRGIAEAAAVNAAEIDIIMGTLSKSLASCGGYIAGSGELVEYLKYTNPAFVYSVGLTPPDTAAALAALTILKREPQRTVCLKRNAQVFLEAAKGRGLDTGRSSGSSVVPIITGDSLLAIRLSEVLFEHRINAQPIFYPAVENDAARLRFFITCDHTEQELVDVAGAVADHLATIRQEPGLTSHVFGR